MSGGVTLSPDQQAAVATMTAIAKEAAPIIAAELAEHEPAVRVLDWMPTGSNDTRTVLVLALERAILEADSVDLKKGLVNALQEGHSLRAWSEVVWSAFNSLLMLRPSADRGAAKIKAAALAKEAADLDATVAKLDEQLGRMLGPEFRHALGTLAGRDPKTGEVICPKGKPLAGIPNHAAIRAALGAAGEAGGLDFNEGPESLGSISRMALSGEPLLIESTLQGVLAIRAVAQVARYKAASERQASGLTLGARLAGQQDSGAFLLLADAFALWALGLPVSRSRVIAKEVNGAVIRPPVWPLLYGDPSKGGRHPKRTHLNEDRQAFRKLWREWTAKRLPSGATIALSKAAPRILQRVLDDPELEPGDF